MEDDDPVSSATLPLRTSVVSVTGGMTSCIVLMTGNLHPSHSCSSSVVIVIGSVFLIDGQDVRSNTAAVSHSTPLDQSPPSSSAPPHIGPNHQVRQIWCSLFVERDPVHLELER